ncbi:hypothetical protein CMQ_893 [Grosmannia clavigera kw1407]|uniref:Uncharacterized protein n=1 Tax=Grosmannia clavigera (strain kw1407 / UAMH 11150) TaxID=655863 RepID=F0XFP4_GROCL|nr:uncharacterized protein CMQ_893 [Grosmannia clavigera kw1407]EFX03965.1 hypothetical protein CMQ_893 [Grosmannia clavigera kw1407]
MGGDPKKKKAAIPLPAPTETTESTVTTATDVTATDLSRATDDKSSYSLPEDGTPVTIKTRGHSSNRSQTSLLIEYYEGSKVSSTDGIGNRKPSVRVRVKQSGSAKNEHIMISKPKSSSNRKVSQSRRSTSGQKTTSSSATRDIDIGGSAISSVDIDDDKSMDSYASATEESNVSRNPIVVEIDRGGSSGNYQRQRSRRPTSPLIPAAASSRGSASYIHGTQSEISGISAIPADSFLDGSKSPKRTDSPSRAFAAAAAATAAAAAGAAAVERNRAASTSRSDVRERVTLPKSSSRDRGREGGSGKKHRSSRHTSSVNLVENEDSPSHRRSSRHRHHNESAVSGADSSVLSSNLSPNHNPYDQYSVRSGGSKTSINNPKLLETVEDAIRRLILPELTALKREHSRKDRRGSTTSTGTSASKEEFDRRRSGASDRAGAASHTPREIDAVIRKENRDREGRHAMDDSPSPSAGYDYDSREETAHGTRSVSETPKKSSDKLKTATAASAAGAALAAAVLADHGDSPSTAREQRRRRRAEARNRGAENDVTPSTPQQGNFDSYLNGPQSASSRSFDDGMQHDGENAQTPASQFGPSEAQLRNTEPKEYLRPPMPLMSEINSDVTRASILSAESDRPRSASDELQTAPVREVSRGIPAMGSVGSPEQTPTKVPALQNLGTQHSNISHGDLKALPRNGLPTAEYAGGDENYENYGDEHETGQNQQSELHHEQEHYQGQYAQHGDGEDYEEYDEMAHYGGQTYDEFGNQIVPAPLNYVPYQPEHRGLSPIPSVSGYTEGGTSEAHRDSIHAGTAVSSPGKSPMPERKPLASPNSARGNTMGRDFDQDGSALDGSALSSNAGYSELAPTQLTDEGSNVYRAVQGIGANPRFVRPPIGVESAVASLVDGSMLEGSALTGGSSVNGGYGLLPGARGSMDTLEEETSYDRANSQSRSVKGYGHELNNEEEPHRAHEQEDSREVMAASPTTTRTNPSEFAGEYELDQYGRKVRRLSPTVSEAAAITAGAIGLVIRAAKDRGQQPHESTRLEEHEGYHTHPDDWAPDGVQRNRSFKERAQSGRYPGNKQAYVSEHTEEHDQPRMSANGLPDLHDPMPEIGFGYEEDDLETNPSLLYGPTSHHDEASWRVGDRTPTQEHHDTSTRSLGLAETPAARVSSQHSRQTSQEHDEWQRSSDDRKRDTLLTNPYEGTSPIVNEDLIKSTLPAVATGAGAAAGYNASVDYATGSPLGARYDEGYETQGPGKSPDLTGTNKGKEVAFPDHMPASFGGQDDPFYSLNQTRHFSGLSQGMGSPLYDPATGAGIDRIENKDIISLMQHLMVRDAQRSARDTEILVTLVRAAAEMRTSFESVKSLLALHEKGISNDFSKKLADSEDAIITEVLDLGPKKQSAPTWAGPVRCLAANIFRRALKSLNAKGNNDLTRIEDMLNQLLLQVDLLKAQTTVESGVMGTTVSGGRAPSPYDDVESHMPYEHEQDRGYEPEGHAGTSTASHASQSGHLSVHSRGGPSVTSRNGGYDRKFSDNRISTVPEANEDDLEYGHQKSIASPRASTPTHARYGSPASLPQMSSALLATPQRQEESVQPLQPQSLPQLQTHNQDLQQTPQSGDNTPRTEKGKKHKSTGSSSWLPKISRWSETTTSSVGRVFRASRDSKKGNEELGYQSGPSRSRSDLASYDGYHMPTDPEGEDKLHGGFSEQDLHHDEYYQPQTLQSETQDYGLNANSTDVVPPDPKSYMTPEDPKYHVHRNSLNLQHPQPRSGQPLKATLESRAENFDSPMSPRSADWAGSATSLHRFPGQNTNRYSDSTATNAAATPANVAANVSQQTYWESQRSGSRQSQGAPPRPPKEPLDESQQATYVTAAQVTSSYTGSPRLENRNLNSALGVPTRRPSGPRAMTPKSERSMRSYNDEEAANDSRRRKRDTFGTVASQDTETF